MGYMQDVDLWLGVLLSEFADDRISLGDLQHAIREKLLESYRNGLKAAGHSPAPREPESRPPRRFVRRR